MLAIKPIPKFNTEEQEHVFWTENDSTEFIDWQKAKPVIFPNLKPSTKTISLRLSETMLYELKLLANKRDVPYQSLIKMFLHEQISKEIKILK